MHSEHSPMPGALHIQTSNFGSPDPSHSLSVQSTGPLFDFSAHSYSLPSTPSMSHFGSHGGMVYNSSSGMQRNGAHALQTIQSTLNKLDGGMQSMRNHMSTIEAGTNHQPLALAQCVEGTEAAIHDMKAMMNSFGEMMNGFKEMLSSINLTRWPNSKPATDPSKNVSNQHWKLKVSTHPESQRNSEFIFIFRLCLAHLNII